ncbi:nucleotidyltransferase domain-containing protein [Rossellomorea aquimaris]|uniref:Nucleotidyltransferase n=1 Tax=Rossellomorea aquimaris TaxID=189382 RepID=A0A1J6W1C5_9BACI|nr:nucleotidyltransferase domain-containing protein [Rossellomorea aquimaris]OIU71397.1 hypothetical protein BHE18_10255 [Rossellomorea aquimaris]
MDHIVSSLLELEDQYGIKIIYAVEAGSRAWGYESEASDYDVRFIYVNRVQHYLSLQNKRDVIEKALPQVELAGWDIKKALTLLHKSNPSILEWLTEENIYIEHDTVNKIRRLADKSFSPYKVLHHYVRMAKKNIIHLENKPFHHVKDYIHIIRPFLSCLWVSKLQAFPPNRISATLKRTDLSETVREDIECILNLKTQRSVLIDKKRFISLIETMEFDLKRLENMITESFGDHTGNIEEFNELFLEILKDIWNGYGVRLTD